MAFNLLTHAREVLERHAPGFDATLAELTFTEREAKHGTAVRRFKEAGPVALLIPKEAGGSGADPLTALHVQFALGARAPSLGIASTMHQFSVASLVALVRQGAGAEALLLRAIAERRLLFASGFAEGVPGRGILDSGITAAETSGGVLLSGSKKPCSLAHSMDLLTASYIRHTETGEELMIALIPWQSKGLTRLPYWRNGALAAAQSDELRLDDVFVPEKMIFSAGLKNRLEPVQTVGFIWFELLMSASYLGACAGLVEQTIERERWSDADRVDLAIDVQLGLSALEGAARDIDAPGAVLDDVLARLLLVRYGVERLVARASDKAHEMLGGTSFIASDESSMWLLSTRGMRFHPPARISLYENLAAYLRGQPFKIDARSSPSVAVLGTGTCLTPASLN